MILPQARVGPYVRALAAALDALAPNQDFPPLAASLDHLRALDPAMSGTLFGPAEVDVRSGMPAFPWLERAWAERRVALEDGPRTLDVERAASLDPELARRLRWRRDVHAHLREHEVLQTSRMRARARRLRSSTEVIVEHDRVMPDGSWSRVGLILAAAPGTRDLGCARVGDQGRIDLDPGLVHLLTRHTVVPVVALRAQVSEVTEGRVRRLSRGRVGPFWFPGVELPERVPDVLASGLVLHLALQVVADDVRTSAHRDPLHRATPMRVPAGLGVVEDRRFAASAALVAPLRQWVENQGVDSEIVPFA